MTVELISHSTQSFPALRHLVQLNELAEPQDKLLYWSPQLSLPTPASWKDDLQSLSGPAFDWQ